MATRRQAAKTSAPAPIPPSAAWARTPVAQDRNGTTLLGGDPVKVLNGKNRGDWIFLNHVSSAKGEWLEVYGCNNDSPKAVRSFAIDKIETLVSKKVLAARTKSP